MNRFTCTRREALRAAGAGAAAWVLSGTRLLSLFADDKPQRPLHEASSYQQLDGNRIQCHVCPFD